MVEKSAQYYSYVEASPVAVKYEAAVYGAVCGFVPPVLAACGGDWESAAWAHFRALLDLRVDAALEAGSTGLFPIFW